MAEQEFDKEVQQENVQQEVVEEKQQQQEQVKEEPQQEEQVTEATEVTEETKEEKQQESEAPEGVDEEPKAEEVKEEEKEEEAIVGDDAKEETTSETTEEQIAPASVEEEVKPAEVLPQEENVEDIKKQLAEKEAELAEERAIQSYEHDVREANQQLDSFLANLSNAMVQEFAKYGIDTNTNLDELKKQDPAKAQVAENIIKQAQAVKAQAMANVQNNLNDRLTDVVFTKASRIFDKYELTNEQGQVAAETFINILTQSGIRDMGDDLIAKVELAVARAKLLKPKVEKVVDDAKEVVKETVEAVKDVIEAKAPEKEEKEKKEEVKEEEIKKEEPEKVEEKEDAPASVVETPTLDEFKEGAVTSNQAAGDAVTVDNVLAKMASLPFKDRVRFYAEHKELAEQAMAKNADAESRKKRI